MPYAKISDLPEAQEAFLDALNSGLKRYGEESRAFAVAHAAAKRTPKKDPTPGD